MTALGSGGAELALGGAALGNLFRTVTDAEARATVDAAWNLGIRTFDTAPHYGLGLSERRLGAALRDRPRTAFTLSTKAGRILEPDPRSDGDDLHNGFAVPATHRRVWDFSADGVRRSLEESLARLGLDRVDTIYLHDPDDHAEQAFREGYPALERLRAEGTVTRIGAGMNQSAMLTRFVRDTDVDEVLCAGRYTLLDQSAGADLLPAALDHGTAVVVGGVFNSGLLADPSPEATYDYTRAPRELLDRARKLSGLARRYGISLRAAALAFPLAHPAVTTVLVGARTPDEIRDAVAQARMRVPDAYWQEARAEGLLPADALVPPVPPVPPVSTGELP
ncbi:aldo/keto reductase [Streptomyces luteolus]|uniref:Aldo/keto reductase n=1 Tax=Streptomyces luteolus TaxID=3043615 RepID=A0ABT6SWS1_9ACTN|nr:aldo/keto reductase [Streptomyces sp. B-S-A12]MDI3420049.1 aldo/keto reductase [Streptomyces sp. B-S-A12]